MLQMNAKEFCVLLRTDEDTRSSNLLQLQAASRKSQSELMKEHIMDF